MSRGLGDVYKRQLQIRAFPLSGMSGLPDEVESSSEHEFSTDAPAMQSMARKDRYNFFIG